jgi:hypothetical protein
MNLRYATNHENIPIRHACPVDLPFATLALRVRLFSGTMNDNLR